MGDKEKKIIEIIDNELKDLEVNETIKNKVLYKCIHQNKVKIYSRLKVASLFLIGILIVSACDQDLLATIKSIFAYTPLKNRVVSLNSELYQLETPITVATENGYIKVVGCELQNGYLEFELNSNIECEFKEWNESIKVIDSQAKEYNLYTNVTGVGKSGEKGKDWIIEVSGNVTDLKSEFKIVTPFGTIPIQATLARELKTIDDIGEITYDQGIYITARKEQEGEYTAVILTAFDEKREQIQASYGIKAYNRDGQEIELDHSRRGKYYFSGPVEEIASIEIKSVSKMKSVKDNRVSLKVPNKEGVQYNKQLEFEEAIVEILDGYIINDTIQIRTRVINSSEGQIEGIRYNFDFKEYRGYQLNRDGEYQTIAILLDKNLPKNITVEITQIDVKIDGKWCIIF